MNAHCRIMMVAHEYTRQTAQGRIEQLDASERNEATRAALR